MELLSTAHLPHPLPATPLALAAAWLDEATTRAVQPNPNAMTLATVAADGRPSARIVLCRGFEVERGCITFFTNYVSRKGNELAATGRAAALFHWDLLHRQVRLEGPVTQLPAAESDAYFHSRPWQSRVGAWASQQSQPVAHREDLKAALDAAATRFGAPVSELGGTGGANDYAIPRPAHWGGYRLWVEDAELWVEAAYRLHDRARWTRTLVAIPPAAPHGEAGWAGGPWQVTRLQP
jgi:pyridoxamine 5'-phosphate oxidase